MDTNTKPVKICLNMIVKNESRIIIRLLESVAPYIDEYVICDTGSTDNTKELIHRFFAERRIGGQVIGGQVIGGQVIDGKGIDGQVIDGKGIDGKGIDGMIIDEPFRDFGYNRSVALKACDAMEADYVLLLDADMVFWVNPEVSPARFREMLKSESGSNSSAFYLLQGTDTFHYKNMRIVKNRSGFSYWGVTHEYVQYPKETVITGIDKNVAFIKDIGDGGSKHDKFIRDIRLLRKGLEDVPNNDRYTFYLANSLKDSQQLDEAIETYKKRIEIGGWIEEIWFSCYSIGKCYQSKGNMESAVYWWMEAYNKYPKRIENLYQIIKYYRIRGNQYLAYTFYTLADYERNKNTNWTEYLFLERDVYDFKLDYELSILGYYVNRDNHDLAKVCMKVLGSYGGDEGTYKNVLSNYKFYTPKLADHSIAILAQNMDVLLGVGRKLLAKHLTENGGSFYQSTPSITISNSISNSNHNNIIVCQRFVNYRIDDKGGYVNQEHIETKNVIAVISGFGTPECRSSVEYEMGYNRELDDRYIGIEDVRIMSSTNEVKNNIILFNGNRGLKDGKMRVEYGCITTDSEIPKFGGIIHYDKSVNIEKNWVLFKDNTNTNNDNNTTNCVYKWNPLTIGKVTTSENSYSLADTWEQKMPNVFNYVRGSTNGVRVDDEIWFITHVVSYEDRRYYYHMVVILDLATMRLKRYTRLFTFEKKPVEYTLGFVYMPDTRRLLIGYSILDRETKYIMVGRDTIDNIMV